MDINPKLDIKRQRMARCNSKTRICARNHVPHETKAFVKKQYERFQSVGERLDLIIK